MSDFKEELHPRDGDGKFAEKAGGGANQTDSQRPYQVSPTSKEWSDFSIDEINRVAFGFTESDITKLSPDDLHIKWTEDLENVQHKIKNSGMSPEEWANSVDLSEPIEVIVEDGVFKIDDGHHRYMAAKIRGEDLPVTVEIKQQPFKPMVEKALARGEEVHPEMLKAAIDRGLEQSDTTPTSQTNSPEFKQWFGKSKVVDDAGKPVVMYHGSDTGFNEFKKDKIRAIDYDAPFNGFWFTSDPESASPAMRDPMAMTAVYVRLENPAPKSVWRKVAGEIHSKPLKEGSRSHDDEVRFALQEMGYDGVVYRDKPRLIKTDDPKVLKVEGIGHGSDSTLRWEKAYGAKWEGDELVDFEVEGWELYHGESAIVGVGDDLEKYLELESEKTVVVFEPTQIKSATGNRGTFDPGDDRINYAKFDESKVNRDKDGQFAEKDIKAWKDDKKDAGYGKRNRQRNKDIEQLTIALSSDPGKDSSARYREAVKKDFAVEAIKEVPEIPSDLDIVASTGDKVVEKGLYPGPVTMPDGQKRQLEDGDPISARLDINAYDFWNVWVPTLHDGSKKGGKAVGYSPTAHLRDIEFQTVPKAAMAIGKGEGKKTIARMNGKWQNHIPDDLRTDAIGYMDNPDWVQVGMNPERHSYFYDKSKGENFMRPVVKAKEVIQIGALVLAKGVEYGDPNDFSFKDRLGDTHYYSKEFDESKVKRDGDGKFAEKAGGGAKADFSNWKRHSDGRLIGYRVSNVSDGKSQSGFDKSQEWKLSSGKIELSGRGAFITHDPEYAKRFYGINDENVLQTVAFRPEDITGGNPDDRETEITIKTGDIVDHQVFFGTDLEDDPITELSTFKKWFGKSKVVNESGEPLKVFHGTFTSFEEFFSGTNFDSHSLDGIGSWFAEDSKLADKLLDFRVNQGTPQSDAQVMSLYLSVQNPVVIPSRSLFESEIIHYAASTYKEGTDLFRQFGEAKELARSDDPDESKEGRGRMRYLADKVKYGLIAKGYDGVKIENDSGFGPAWVALNATQIKSASGNKGSFDPDDERINYSRDQLVERFQKAFDESKVKRDGDGKFAEKAGGGASQTDSPEFKQWFGKSQVVDESGSPLKVFHGTPHNFTEFDENKLDDHALFGPGFYFTEDSGVAGGDGSFDSGYSHKGADARLQREVTDSDVSAFRMQASRGFRRGGELEPHEIDKEAVESIVRNVYKELPQYARFSSLVFKRNLALPVSSSIMPLHVKIENPVDLDGNVTPEMKDRMHDAVSRLDHSYPDVMRDIIENLYPGEYEKIGDFYTSLSIQLGKKDANKLFQLAGYDGFTHIGGGIRGEKEHRVWIAFNANQIKSATGNKGSFDPDDERINYSLADQFKQAWAEKYARPEQYASQGDLWVPYRGKLGGTGWKNTRTGRVAYQEEMPGMEPGQDTKTPDRIGNVKIRTGGVPDDGNRYFIASGELDAMFTLRVTKKLWRRVLTGSSTPFSPDPYENQAYIKDYYVGNLSTDFNKAIEKAAKIIEKKEGANPDHKELFVDPEHVLNARQSPKKRDYFYFGKYKGQSVERIIENDPKYIQALWMGSKLNHRNSQFLKQKIENLGHGPNELVNKSNAAKQEYWSSISKTKELQAAVDRDPNNADLRHQLALADWEQAKASHDVGQSGDAFWAWYKDKEFTPKAFNKPRPEKRKIAAEPYVGTVGEKAELEGVRYVDDFTFDGQYGPVTVIEFDHEGRTMKWFSTGSVNMGWLRDNAGTPFNMSATIKDHGEYQGVPETKVSRANLYIPQPYGSKPTIKDLPAILVSMGQMEQGEKTGGYVKDAHKYMPLGEWVNPHDVAQKLPQKTQKQKDTKKGIGAAMKKFVAAGLVEQRWTENGDVVYAWNDTPETPGLLTKEEADAKWPPESYAKFDESKHPRDADGKFATKEGGGSTSTEPKPRRKIKVSPRKRAEKFGKWFRKSKVVDKDGKPLVVYHGTGRPDRIGNYFDPERATSGPMAFFTDDPEIASGYAGTGDDSGKRDTSLDFSHPTDAAAWEVNGIRLRDPESDDWEFRRPDQHDAWESLDPAMRVKLRKILPLAGVKNYGENGETEIDFSGEFSPMARDSWDWRQKNEHRGDPLTTLFDVWVQSSGDVEEFERILKAAGVPYKFEDPLARYPSIYPVHLRIENPLDTSNIPDEVLAALKQAAANHEGYYKEPPLNSDQWDKRNKTPEDWIELLEFVPASAWTSIPDWVTSKLTNLGYDGIKDKGGKYQPREHTVWIPFNDNQVKSATGNFGTYDDDAKNINYAKAFDESKHPRDKDGQFADKAGGGGGGMSVNGLVSYLKTASAKHDDALMADKDKPLLQKTAFKDFMEWRNENDAQVDKLIESGVRVEEALKPLTFDDTLPPGLRNKVFNLIYKSRNAIQRKYESSPEYKERERKRQEQIKAAEAKKEQQRLDTIKDIESQFKNNATLHYSTPNWRGVTPEKIKKHLKTVSSNSRFNHALLTYDDAEDVEAHLFYHGSGGGIGRLKPSIALRDFTSGGGYGESYWGISLSKDRNIASNFTGQSSSGNVAPVLLSKKARVVTIPWMTDAAEAEDFIVDLWKNKIDAVVIGSLEDGERELLVINPKAITVGRSEGFSVFNKKPTPSFTIEQIEEMRANAPKVIKELRAKSASKYAKFDESKIKRDGDGKFAPKNGRNGRNGNGRNGNGNGHESTGVEIVRVYKNKKATVYRNPSKEQLQSLYDKASKSDYPVSVRLMGENGNLYAWAAIQGDHFHVAKGLGIKLDEKLVWEANNTDELEHWYKAWLDRRKKNNYELRRWSNFQLYAQAEKQWTPFVGPRGGERGRFDTFAELYSQQMGLFDESKVNRDEDGKFATKSSSAAPDDDDFELKNKPNWSSGNFPGKTGTQRNLLSGLDALPGQQDLFDDVDKEEDSTELAEKEWKEQNFRSKYFKGWFGDWEKDPGNASKVMDEETKEPAETTQLDSSKVTEDGMPVLVHHGTVGDFETFDIQKASPTALYGPGFYFTQDDGIAGEYQGKAVRDYEDGFKDRLASNTLTDQEKEFVFSYLKKYTKIELKKQAKRQQHIDSSGDSTWDWDEDEILDNYTDEDVYRAASYEDGEMLAKALGDDSSSPGRAYFWKENLKGELPVPEMKVHHCYLNIRNPAIVDKPITSEAAKKLSDVFLRINQGQLSNITGDFEKAQKVLGGIADNAKLLENPNTHGGEEPDLWEAFNKISNYVGTKTSDGMIPLSGEQRVAILKAAGYDGITHTGGNFLGTRPHKVWIAFEPNQIKSVDNRGTFDPDDDRVSYSKWGDANVHGTSGKPFGAAAPFNEADHPRAPEGSSEGGQFVSKDSSASASSSKEDEARSALATAKKRGLRSYDRITKIEEMIDDGDYENAIWEVDDWLVDKKPRQAAPKEPKKEGKRVGAEVLSLKDIKADPPRFQYKVQNIGEQGVTREFSDVEYDPLLAGMLYVWEDPESGETYVINGHHRYEIGVRSGYDGTVPVYFMDAADEKEARALGAIVNIAEGHGTALDAAKFMRDMGKPGQLGVDYLKSKNVSLKGKVAADALLLSGLSDTVFRDLSYERITIGQALAIAGPLQADKDASEAETAAIHDAQNEVLRAVQSSSRKVSDEAIHEMAEDAMASPMVQNDDGPSLFGDDETFKKLMVDRGEVKAAIRKELSKIKSRFAGFSVKGADALASQAGVGEIDRDKALEKKAEATNILDLFETEVRLKGDIGSKLNEIINQAAEEHNGKRNQSDRRKVKDRAKREVREFLKSLQGPESGQDGPVTLQGDGYGQRSGAVLEGSAYRLDRGVRRYCRDGVEQYSEWGEKNVHGTATAFKEHEHPRDADGKFTEKGKGQSKKDDRTNPNRNQTPKQTKRKLGAPVTQPIYLSGTATPELAGDIAEGNLFTGILPTPKTANLISKWVASGKTKTWALDNGAFGLEKQPDGKEKMVDKFDPVLYQKSFDEISKLPQEIKDQCLYVSIPDYPGDWEKTKERMGDWPEKIRAAGFKPALVVQDGVESDLESVEWDRFDVVFIGGSDDFKLGYKSALTDDLGEDWTDSQVKQLLWLQFLWQVKKHKKWLHVGKVNSYMRFAFSFGIGADSVDGNYLRFGPKKNWPTLKKWMDRMKESAETDFSWYQKRFMEIMRYAAAVTRSRYSKWSPYVGPRGGKGWTNSETGEVVYGDKPGERTAGKQESLPFTDAGKEEAAPKKTTQFSVRKHGKWEYVEGDKSKIKRGGYQHTLYKVRSLDGGDHGLLVEYPFGGGYNFYEVYSDFDLESVDIYSTEFKKNSTKIASGNKNPLEAKIKKDANQERRKKTASSDEASVGKTQALHEVNLAVKNLRANAALMDDDDQESALRTASKLEQTIPMILDNLGPKAQAAVGQVLYFRFYANARELNSKNSDMGGFGDSGKGTTAGFYRHQLDDETSGELHLTWEGVSVSPPEVIAHEMSHAIDGTAYFYSRSNDWRRVWREEIGDRAKNGWVVDLRFPSKLSQGKPVSELSGGDIIYVGKKIGTGYASDGTYRPESGWVNVVDSKMVKEHGMELVEVSVSAQVYDDDRPGHTKEETFTISSPKNQIFLEQNNREIPRTEVKLGAYATTKPSEGFAEFGALVALNPSMAKKEFPKCWALWEKWKLVNPNAIDFDYEKVKRDSEDQRSILKTLRELQAQ